MTCLNTELGLKKAKIINVISVTKNTVVTKIIFILSIKRLMYFFNFSLNLNRFIVNKIWANISKKINKIMINLLILANNFESISMPKKIACNIKNKQEHTP